jgi:hypothetical protein
MVLRLNRSQPGPEALNQIISKGGHLPGPEPLDTNSSRALQHYRLGSPIGIFTLEMCEPVCETVKRAQRSAVLPCKPVPICRLILGARS